MTECYLCSRHVELDLTVRVDFGVFVTDVCVFCMERADEAEDVEEEGAA